MGKNSGWGSPHITWKWIPLALLAAVIVAGFFELVGSK
jgi:hypothetical protein